MKTGCGSGSLEQPGFSSRNVAQIGAKVGSCIGSNQSKLAEAKAKSVFARRRSSQAEAQPTQLEKMKIHQDLLFQKLKSRHWKTIKMSGQALNSCSARTISEMTSRVQSSINLFNSDGKPSRELTSNRIDTAADQGDFLSAQKDRKVLSMRAIPISHELASPAQFSMKEKTSTLKQLYQVPSAGRLHYMPPSSAQRTRNPKKLEYYGSMKTLQTTGLTQ